MHCVRYLGLSHMVLLEPWACYHNLQYLLLDLYDLTFKIFVGAYFSRPFQLIVVKICYIFIFELEDCGYWFSLNLIICFTIFIFIFIQTEWLLSKYLNRFPLDFLCLHLTNELLHLNTFRTGQASLFSALPKEEIGCFLLFIIFLLTNLIFTLIQRK